MDSPNETRLSKNPPQSTADNPDVLEVAAPGKFMLLPPAPGKCHLCAVDHQESMAHNAESVYYQVRFYMKHKRTGRWSDAVAHCPEEIQKLWIAQLRKRHAWTEEDDAALAETRAVAEPTTYTS